MNFTRNGLRLGSRHQEPPHTDVSRNLATVVIMRGLTWAKEKKNWTVTQCLKSSFQMRASLYFIWKTRVLESGGRVKKLIAHVAWSPVLSFHSLWLIWGAMSSAGVGPLCFLKTNITAPIYQDILEHFMLLSADQLFKDADFHFPAGFGSCPHCQKAPKVGLNEHGVGVLDWPANSPDLNPRESMGIVKRKMRNKRPKNADELKATVKETWASIPPQQCHKLITSMPRRIEAVIKVKGAPTKYWVHIQQINILSRRPTIH